MAILSVKQLVAEAAAATEQVSPAKAVALIGQPDVVFVDVREQSELDTAGRVAGSVHVPRGLLEAKADPGSPTHDPALSSGKRLVTYCATGARGQDAGRHGRDAGRARAQWRVRGTAGGRSGNGHLNVHAGSRPTDQLREARRYRSRPAKLWC